MTRVWLTGGRDIPVGLGGDTSRHRYAEALLVGLDLETGEAEVALRWRCEPDARANDGGSDIFKAASWDGPHLLLCTETEVLWFDPHARAVVRRVSLPAFNDVHHVERIGGRVHVVSTGLDAVVVLNADDTDASEIISCVDGEVWERHDPQVDWRRVPSTKPHPVHTNFVFSWHGEPWVGRHIPGDAVPLAAHAPATPVCASGIHDGLVHDGAVWFTAVDGRVIRVVPGTDVRTEWSLADLHGPNGLGNGWCRGLLPVGDLWWVGFTRMRRTAWIERARKFRDALGGTERYAAPTRLEAFDLQGNRFVRAIRFDQGALAELSAVFSILPDRG